MGIRIAVVGCGAVAEMGHIPAARRLEHVQLAALVDTDRTRADRLAQAFEVAKTAGSLSEVAGEVDAIILSTPPHVRPDLAQQAFGARLAVLCEKPLANTSSEGRVILEAARRANRVLAVAHTYRFSPNRMHVHALLHEESLGRVTSVDVEQGDPYDWPTRTGYTVRRELVSGGVLLNEGVHVLDTLFWWFGTPDHIEYEDDSLSGVESNVRLKLRFPGGVSGNFRLSRTCKLANRILIESEAGHLSLPIYDQSTIHLTRCGRTTTRKLASHDWDFVGAVTEQLRNFVRSIETETPPRTTGEDGLAVVDFIEKCYAAKRQRPMLKRAPIPGVTW